MFITLSTPPTIATEEDLQLELFVEPSCWEGLYDSMEVWRSRFSPQGPYWPLTGTGWQPATLPVGAPPPPNPTQTGPLVTIVGLVLTLLVNEKTALTITFTGTNPLTFAQVAAQIIAQGEGLVTAYVVNNLLVIQTVQAGSISTLRCTGGDAAALLGVPTCEPGNVAMGLDARIQLKVGVTQYQYVDHNGCAHFFYKTRFYNSITSNTSSYSTPYSGKTVTRLPPSNMVRATVALVNSSGVALRDRAVLLHPKFTGACVDGRTLVDNEVRVLTDENGCVELYLVRGQPFTIAIAGTDIVRDFCTPTDPTIESFNMLDPVLSKNDVFTVAVPCLDFAVRRHL